MAAPLAPAHLVARPIDVPAGFSQEIDEFLDDGMTSEDATAWRAAVHDGAVPASSMYRWVRRFGVSAGQNLRTWYAAATNTYSDCHVLALWHDFVFFAVVDHALPADQVTRWLEGPVLAVWAQSNPTMVDLLTGPEPDPDVTYDDFLDDLFGSFGPRSVLGERAYQWGPLAAAAGIEPDEAARLLNKPGGADQIRRQAGIPAPVLQQVRVIPSLHSRVLPA